MRTTLGFVGLGKMGKPIVANLVAAGFPVLVYDVHRAAVTAAVDGGAVAARSVAELASRSEVVLTSLPGPAEVEQVAAEVLPNLPESRFQVDMTSNSPELVRELGGRFVAAGRHFVDAPIGGRSMLAASRDLQVMVGATEDEYRSVEPILQAIAKRVIHCGPVGSGSVCKLMHNAINAVFRQTAAECFTAAVKSGVDPLVLWEIVRNGITCGGSEINKTMRSTWLRGDFDTGTGALRSHRKDTALALEVGDRIGVPMPHTALTLARLDEAVERGWGERDATVSLLLQEELAGVAVRIPDSAEAEQSAKKEDPK